ncbi:hypothetical protein D9M70_533320 [compost metagenome]
MIGSGARKTDCMATPFGPPLKVVTPATSSIFLPPASSTATSAARLPSSRLSFQTETVCVPKATRFSAALSASWPETGTEPARPCASRAAMAPPAVPSLEATTASTLLSLAVRNCSMFFWAFSGFQPSV